MKSPRGLIALVAIAGLLVPSVAHALEGTMSTEGGAKTKFGPPDRFVGLKYELKAPRDFTSGAATGRRVHSPVCVTRAVSATTPSYFTVLVNNEVLKSVSFDGVNGLKIRLTNANVNSLTFLGGTDGKDLEEICFVFQKIEITVKGVTATDDWRSQA